MGSQEEEEEDRPSRLSDQFGQNGEIQGDQLRSLIERVERLEEEKSDIAVQVKEVFEEAKSGGFDPKIMRKVIRLRRMDPRELDAEETLVYLYRQALGMSS